MDALIGSTSAAVATIAVYPIDTIKLNFQIHGKTFSQTVNDVYTKGGIRAFYNGIVPTLATYPIFWGIFFGTRNTQFRYTGNKHMDNVLTTAYSATLGSFIANPLFVFKTRFQSKENTLSYPQMITQMYRKEGMQSFMKGFPSTVLSNAKLCIQFPLYDSIRERTDSVIFSSGAAKIIANTIVYPLDIARSVQRTATERIEISRVFVKLIQEYGFRGLWRGSMIANAFSVPNFIITMYFVEWYNSIQKTKKQ